jgi:tetratricopeptide (TPR) repeat protein
MAFALLSLATPAFFLGRWGEARADGERAVALVRQGPVTVRTSIPIIGIGALDLCEGKEASAVRYLEEALALTQRLGDLQYQRLTQSWLAEADLVRGQSAAAQARLEPLRGRPGELADDTLPMLPLLARAYLEQGNVAQAQATLDEGLSQAPPLHRLEFLRIQALLWLRQGQGQAAEAAVEEALGLCRGMGYLWAEAKVLFVFGQVYAAQGKSEPAREQYRSALTICAQLGEELYRPRIERALAALDP